MNPSQNWRGMPAALLLSGLCAFPASARTICTVVADAANGRPLLLQGECSERYTPASSFKIALSLMGFDSGILKDEHTPSWQFQPGYPDWGGEAWRQPTDPSRWIRYSVVWYSQQLAERLGQDRFQQYTSAFGYGNQDVSGDPGKHNGTQGAWNISSLRISPLEQLAFLRKIVNRQLPVSAHAYDMTARIFEQEPAPDGWRLYGKTGTGSPGSNGAYDRNHAYGWFVGWAEKGERKLVFARLIQDEQAATPNAGMRARDAFIQEFPGLVNANTKD